MASEEKNAWIMGLVAIAGYATYLAIILSRAGTTPLPEVPYVSTLLWCIGGAIALGIVLSIAAAALSPEDAGQKDQRDREIGRFGEHVGKSFLVIGGLAALALALAEASHFWIANVLYLGFVLSAILECIAKVVAYRRGFQPW